MPALTVSQECQNPRQRWFFVHCDLDLRPIDPKINGFPSFTAEHFYVKFGAPSCFLRYHAEKDRQTIACENLTPVTTINMVNYNHHRLTD